MLRRHLFQCIAHGGMTTMLVVVLLACTPPPTNSTPVMLAANTPSPTSEEFINETTATDIARQIAMRGDGHLTSAVGALTNLHAERAPVATAQQRLVALGWTKTIIPPSDQMVWFVTMEGTWRLTGGPAPMPTPFPTLLPQDLHSMVIVLDAKTGAEIGVWAH